MEVGGVSAYLRLNWLSVSIIAAKEIYPPMLKAER